MPGHVEIFRGHDEGYYKAFVDGQDASVVYKGNLGDCMSHRRWRREIAKNLGIREDDLRYTHYDLAYTRAAQNDAVDENDYQGLLAIVAGEHVAPAFTNWTLDDFEDQSYWQ